MSSAVYSIMGKLYGLNKIEMITYYPIGWLLIKALNWGKARPDWFWAVGYHLKGGDYINIVWLGLFQIAWNREMRYFSIDWNRD